MAEKSGSNVTPPVHEEKNIASDTGVPTTKDDVNQQHHGDTQKAPQDERNIGQNTGTGRPAITTK